MSRPASTITVSRSKRGTTIKAHGAAAQAMFSALTQTAKSKATLPASASASALHALASVPPDPPCAGDCADWLLTLAMTEHAAGSVHRQRLMLCVLQLRWLQALETQLLGLDSTDPTQNWMDDQVADQATEAFIVPGAGAGLRG